MSPAHHPARTDYPAAMSFGLGHGRTLDDAPGVVGLTSTELPTLPDAIMSDASGEHRFRKADSYLSLSTP